MKGLSAAIVAALMLGACASPRTVAPVARDTMTYSTELARAQQEQLLLNIVRLRYNDPVSFVEVETLSTEDSGSVSGGIGGVVGISPGDMVDVISPAGTVERSATPTVVYRNLRGGAYAEQLLQPVAPESIFLLSQSGWSVERLMLCCIARIGDLDNARAAAGPTPSVLPDNSSFRRLAAQMRDLQISGDLLVQVLEGDAEGDKPRVVVSWHGGTPAGEALAAQMRQHHISLRPGLDNGFHVADISSTGRTVGTSPARGRSILGMLSALSQTVDVPPEHAALVGNTSGGIPQRQITTCSPAAPWATVMDDYFAVRWSKEKPKGAAVAVPYRGYWFHVDDTCRNAKSTLDLIGHLYALQAGLAARGTSNTLLLIGN
ncbi:MAG: hypothetical protein R3C13_11065 [Hyphomonas sp.]|uniref:hypothetical protein n=1 Tax=Hyphomonas sp. TaxID=87 RepID=UPI003527DA90